MNFRLILTSALFIVFFGMSYSATARNTKTPSLTITRNERFVIQALKTIHSAEATFQATTGNGNYGSLAQLGQNNLIDSALASGNKYGYVFTLTTQNQSPGTPAHFSVVAVPRYYRKTGRRSFYTDLNNYGLILGADKQGNPANQSDPPIQEMYTCISEAECEAKAIDTLRTIHSAEVTYQGTTGNGNYGSLAQLRQQSLIDSVLANGSKYGYFFTVTTQNSSQGTPANFTIVAVPHQYGGTGRRSFYTSADGVIRGADKQGNPANQSDPIIEEMYTCGSVAECEAKAISSIRTIHGAEATYQATSGNGNFGSLCQLGEANLIDQILSTGSKFGYYFVVSHRERTSSQPATFEVIAIPRRYPNTGRRSFYIDTTGVIYGADKNGAPANENDPPVEN